MSIDEIINKHKELEYKLNQALSTMEKKDTIRELRAEIANVQAACPHFSNKYNWEPKNERCPYCGVKLK